MKKSALVVFSGGQDSTTCLGWAKSRFEYIQSVTFDYGQKHRVEIEQAKKIAKMLNIPNRVLSIDAFSQLNDSALIDSSLDISSSHKHKPNLPASFVPNRNAIFFTIAHAYAQKQGIGNIITGINQTDYSGYPDCRKEFIEVLQKALNLGSESDIKFHYPLINLSKAETFKLAKDVGILEIVIKESHTCYNADRTHFYEWGYGCGDCPACLLRKKGWDEFKSLE
jgi:7-cyano-7-deazaguanine synthase